MMRNLKIRGARVTLELQNGFCLGDYEIRPMQGTISGSDGPSHVQPKVMEVLVCLANRPGEVVSRSELLEEAWGHNVVSDEVLTRVISELRHALNDQPGNPAYVQTIPRRGYRLVAEVSELSEREIKTAQVSAAGGDGGWWNELKRRGVVGVGAAYMVAAWVAIQIASEVSEPLGFPGWVPRLVIVLAIGGFPIAVVMAWALEITPEGIMLDRGQKTDKRRLSGIRLLATVAVWLVSAGIVLFLLRELPEDPAETSTQPSLPPLADIAVLPFENLGSPEDASLADGLAYELTNILSGLDELKVSSSRAAFEFRNIAAGSEEIGQKLRVRHYLEGTVRTGDGRIVVGLQLHDIAAGYNIWAKQLDAPLDDLMDLQERIARNVIADLVPVLSPESESVLASRITLSPQAYQYYLQGWEALRKPKSQPVLEFAVTQFKQAIDLDDGFAAAYAGLCNTYLSFYEFNSDTQNFQRAEQSCNQALALDASQTEVRTALGALFRYSGDDDRAIVALNKALQAKAESVEARYELALIYQKRGLASEAEALLKESIELEPGYWGNYAALANLMADLGRYGEAVAPLELASSLNPGNASVHNNLGAVHYMLDNFEAAAQNWSRSLDVRPTRTAFTNLGLMNYYTGQFEAAASAQESALQLAPEDHRLWGRLAESRRFLPDDDANPAEAYEKAAALARKNLEINPGNQTTRALLALYLTHLEQPAESEALISEALAEAPRNSTIVYINALIQVYLGRLDSAFDNLEKAIALGFSKRLIREDPDLAILKTDARFATALQSDP